MDTLSTGKHEQKGAVVKYRSTPPQWFEVKGTVVNYRPTPL